MTIAINFATVTRENYTLVNKSAGLLSDSINKYKMKDSNVSLV